MRMKVKKTWQTHDIYCILFNSEPNQDEGTWYLTVTRWQFTVSNGFPTLALHIMRMLESWRLIDAAGVLNIFPTQCVAWYTWEISCFGNLSRVAPSKWRLLQFTFSIKSVQLKDCYLMIVRTLAYQFALAGARFFVPSKSWNKDNDQPKPTNSLLTNCCNITNETAVAILSTPCLFIAFEKYCSISCNKTLLLPQVFCTINLLTYTKTKDTGAENRYGKWGDSPTYPIGRLEPTNPRVHAQPTTWT